MLLYRIAHPDSMIGPYNHAFDENANDTDLIYKMSSNHSWRSARKNHPVLKHPNCDFGYYLSAFRSLEQLKAWFYKYRKGLRELGFKMYIFDVPRVAMVDRFQVVFDTRLAKQVATRRIP